ncbi:MAG: discoidin domain-containing protein [Desulfobacterales bacterium]|nr:discoidin domain-containing protein [Desulfobacterales bacterium]
MLKIRTKDMRYWIAIFLLILACPWMVYAEDDLYGSANVSYRSTQTKTGQEKSSTWSLNQTYKLGLTKEFTPNLNLVADLGVNVNETDDTKTTRLYPDMRLNLSNEYFNADTGYRLTEKGLDILTMVSDEDRFTTESWSTNFYTKFEKYPKLRLRYNQDKNYDHLAIHQTNTKTDTFSGSADYAYRFLNFYYDYTNKTSDDYVVDSTQKTDTHDGRIDFRKSFWGNKITSSGSYSLKETTTETKTGGEAVDVAEKKSASDGLYTNDSSPLDGALTSENELIDDNKATSTTPVIDIGTNTDQNIGVDLTFSTEIEKIYLYTTIKPDSASTFTWAVYYSSDNSAWTLITAAAGFDYNTIQKRFEISFAKTSARYFKVVNTTKDDTVLLYVTEIEAYSVSTQTPYTTAEDVTTAQTAQANLGFRPFNWLSFIYDLKQDQQEKESGASTTKTRRTNHDISGLAGKEFQVHKYLKVLPQYQKRLEYEDGSDGEIDRSTDTYRVHFFSSPLSTLDTDLSLNHRVLKKDSETQSKTSSGLLHIVARLREGADLDIDADITRTENIPSNTESTTKSINSELRLKLTSALTSEIEYNINWSETEAPAGTTTGCNSHAKATIYWRPSHDFYFRGSYGVDRDEKSGDQTSRQDYNMNWLLTEKLQLSMDYAIDRNDTVKTSYSSDLSWNLSRTFTFRFGYDWSLTEAATKTETQTFSADLSARF